MKAAVLTAPERLEIADVPAPEPGPGEHLVRLEWAGICGTDLHSFRGDNPLLALPRILGHELAGRVAGGDGPLAVGTPVAIDPMLTCGRCRPCRIGRPNCCVEMQVLGVHVDGGFRPAIAVPAGMLHVLPESLPLSLGALVEPLTIGANATLRGEVTAGDAVLVQGAGAIGLAALLCAKARGARVMVADALPFRLDLARTLGADTVIDVRRDDVLDRVQEFTNDEGAAVVIEAAGRVDVLRQAFDLVAPAGIVVTLMIGRESLDLPVTNLMIKKELDFRGSRLNRDLFPEVIAMVADGRLDPTPMITHRVPLISAPAAFNLLLSRPGEACKVLLELT